MLAHEMPVKYLCDKLWIIMLLKLNHSSSYHLSYSIYKHYVLKIADPSSMQDACHMNFVIDLTYCRVSVAQWQSIRVQNPKVSSSIPHGVSLSHAHIKTKTIFLYFSTELKTYHLSNYKHDAIEITDPSSMQDVCHMNFVIDFAHSRVSVAQW